MQSRRKVGFFIAPFIALLTLGLQKPGDDGTYTDATNKSSNNNKLQEANPTDATLPREPGAIAKAKFTENKTAATVQFPGIPESANNFSLSARLTSMAMLNRPKTTRAKIKSAGMSHSLLPHTLRNIKASAAIEASKTRQATILIFPIHRRKSIARPLVRAA